MTTDPALSTGSTARSALVETSKTSLPLFVGWACAVVVVARLTFVAQPLRFDESGYLMVARQWYGDGEFLYGDYWVDRPPGLLLIFKLAAMFESDQAVRVVAIPFALLFVVAAARAAWLVAGNPAARLATVVAAALVATPATGADQADGELFAVPLVMGAIALFLEARRRSTSAARFWTAVAAGVLAAGAPLVKQNFLEGLLFGVVLTFVAWRRSEHRSGIASTAAGGLLGAAVPMAALLCWTYFSHFDVAGLADELLGFRADALSTIVGQRSTAAVWRWWTLLGLAVVSGIVPILALTAKAGWRRRRCGSPEAWATSSIATLSVVGVVAGGSYWPHYLLQLLPATVLGTALLVRDPAFRRRVERISATAFGSAMIATAGMALFYAVFAWGWWPQRTGEWLQTSSRPGDTAVVLYGGAAVQLKSDLESPYPYLWSLPVRVLDPELERLEATLSGPAAPTWIVQRSAFDSWGIDEEDRLRTEVENAYRVVAEVCGRPVWLDREVTRDLAALPRC